MSDSPASSIKANPRSSRRWVCRHQPLLAGELRKCQRHGGVAFSVRPSSGEPQLQKSRRVPRRNPSKRECTGPLGFWADRKRQGNYRQEPRTSDRRVTTKLISAANFCCIQTRIETSLSTRNTTNAGRGYCTSVGRSHLLQPVRRPPLISNKPAGTRRA